MAKGTHHSFTTVDGKTFTRTSQNRIYTAVIVGRYNYAAERARIQSADARKFHANYYNYYKAVIAGQHNSPYDTPEQQASKIEKARLAVEGLTMSEYINQCIQAELSKIAQYADEGPEQVLQWSQSLANAYKALSKHSFYVKLRVSCDVKISN